MIKVGDENIYPIRIIGISQMIFLMAYVSLRVCRYIKVKTPNIDKVLKWYEKFADVEYFVNEEYKGKDLI